MISTAQCSVCVVAFWCRVAHRCVCYLCAWSVNETAFKGDGRPLGPTCHPSLALHVLKTEKGRCLTEGLPRWLTDFLAESHNKSEHTARCFDPRLRSRPHSSTENFLTSTNATLTFDESTASSPSAATEAEKTPCADLNAVPSWADPSARLLSYGAFSNKNPATDTQGPNKETTRISEKTITSARNSKKTKHSCKSQTRVILELT